jgi:hypothetical protein
MARGRPARTTVYERLDHALRDLWTRYGGLPSPSESKYVWADIWHLEAHHSTALEGNTLVLREVEALLDRGRAIGAKPLREYMEVKGYGDAAQWVYDQAHAVAVHDDLLTVQEVRNVHHVVMAPVWGVAPHPDATSDESPGNFRRHDIRPFEGGMAPPTWPLVGAELDAWIDEVNDAGGMLGHQAQQRDMPVPEIIAAIHNKFERIHPFIDGNGRTGRLLLNLVLVRLGYPPVIILKRQRPLYLSAMVAADRGECGPLGELLARAMIDNLNRFILPSVAGPARLVPLAALSDKDITLVGLRAAARRGRLDAEQDAQGQWLSTRRAVEEYKRSRQHHGRNR